jgi:hypothetical protein
MFYSTNQSYPWKSYQSEVAISGRLTNQKPGKKNQSEFFFIFHYTCLISNNATFCTIVVASMGFSFPDILFSLSASYNLIIFYELALLMVICLFPAILFSLSASYDLIIFYELALLLVICPFPAILFLLSASYNLIIFYELSLLLVICLFPAILFSLCASSNLIISTN